MKQGDEETSEKCREVDVRKCRHTPSHKILVEILQDGYHESFREMFNLLQRQPELESKGDTVLQFIKENLLTVERSSRKSDMTTVYNSQVALALFLEEQGYREAARFFYEKTHHTGMHVRGDGRRKEAEANYNLGRFCERSMEHARAEQYYKQFLVLSQDTHWKSGDGKLLSQLACECLQRVYIAMAKKLDREKEKSRILELLHIAYDTTKSGECTKTLSEVILIIGETHESYNDSQQALDRYKELLALCQQSKDKLGIAKAYQCLGSACQRMGDSKEALGYLKLFLGEAEISRDTTSMFEACRDMGALYNCLGNYEQAVKYYERAFEMSGNDECRCEYAVALANQMQNHYVSAIVDNTRLSVDCLLQWKNNRGWPTMT